MEKNYKRHLITAALPYANGPVHIGHLAGVYIPADIYVRYLRLRKRDVKFVCGSDEHGVPITLKARKEGVTPQDIVDKYHTIIKKAFEDFGISFDIYSRTSAKIHHETASEFFQKIYETGIFIEKTSEQYYDTEVGQFLADRYIIGTCPKCHWEEAFGDQCEKCGSSLSPEELINPQSTLSGSQPIKKETKHWYLPLNRYEDFLKTWILDGHKEWKSNVYGQCKSWISQGLKPRAVSRDLDWGVPVPVEGYPGKVLYVWFDAPIGYISATKELTPEWEKYWKSDDTKLVHFIGKDNIVFHCIIFPVMLKAEGSFILPENVPANEFLNLENDKISTSKNWAVWLHEYLEDFKDQQDVLRYVLTANAPETKDNDFTWKDFQSRNNNELVAILGNFVNRTLVLTNKYYQGIIPPKRELNDNDKEVLKQLPLAKRNIEKAIENYNFREALKEAMSIARLGNKYLTDNEPWALYKTDKERVKTIMNICLQITVNLSVLIEPFLPFTAHKLREIFNIVEIDWEHAGTFDLLLDGRKINKPTTLLFRKIEDEQIEAQKQKLINIKEKQAKKTSQLELQKENIGFEIFQKLDIRTGTIIEAEKVVKTKKLLKIKVDTGIDKRILVSGIAEYHKPEDIIGKQVAVLLNLEPRKIRGIESQGMILMAENEDKRLEFIRPEEITNNGATIR